MTPDFCVYNLRAASPFHTQLIHPTHLRPFYIPTGYEPARDAAIRVLPSDSFKLTHHRRHLDRSHQFESLQINQIVRRQPEPDKESKHNPTLNQALDGQLGKAKSAQKSSDHTPFLQYTQSETIRRHSLPNQ